MEFSIFYLGASAVAAQFARRGRSPCPSVMRITKLSVGGGWRSAIPEVCQLIYTGLVQTLHRSPITLFGCDTRARFVARLFTFEQRNDRARLLNRIDGPFGGGKEEECRYRSNTIRSISLVKNCTNFLFSSPLSLPPVYFGLLAFLLFALVSILSRRDTGGKRVAFCSKFAVESTAWKRNSDILL